MAKFIFNAPEGKTECYECPFANSDICLDAKFPELDCRKYDFSTLEIENMNKKLAIKGHATRGKEVIELLKMLGGCDSGYGGLGVHYYYYISQFGNIEGSSEPYKFNTYIVFTLEEFLDKYPFKVGDKVFLYDNITEGCVTGMEWDEDKGTVKYCVYTSSEYWCDVKDLLKWNNVDLVERHYMNNMEEKDKAKAPDIKGEDYSGKRFGYKIPDGYEFDVVVDGKIILKPIKPKYPKTYEGCCKITEDVADASLTCFACNLLNNFQKLLLCRDAYWEIAGEQMGLGKPWEPNWNNSTSKYTIVVIGNDLVEHYTFLHNCILAFPTEEMRDAFYENFKDLIEQCKELL